MNYTKYKQIREDLADFFRVCHSKHYPAKSVLSSPGDTHETLHYVREGLVVIIMENEQGEELIVDHLNQGDFIGEVGFFTENLDKTMIVKAKTDCRIEEISYQKIRSLSSTTLHNCYPKLLALLGESMAKRLLSATRKTSELAFLDVTDRVSSALHELSIQPNAIKHERGVQIKATRQEISRMVGCSREMAGRVLRGLQERGLVWAHGKTMIIYDQDNKQQSAA